MSYTALLIHKSKQGWLALSYMPGPTLTKQAHRAEFFGDADSAHQFARKNFHDKAFMLVSGDKDAIIKELWRQMRKEF